MRRLLRLMFGLVALVMLLYVVGFAFFMALLPSPRVGLPPVDGVAVFTGGSGRVASGLQVVRDGFAGPVLISGVHPDVTLAEMERQVDANGEGPVSVPLALTTPQRAQLTLDMAALTTRENVVNTLTWARQNGIEKLAIITSTYHVPRVRVLLLWLAPELSVTILPVQPAEVGTRFLWREYNKLLGVFFIQ